MAMEIYKNILLYTTYTYIYVCMYVCVSVRVYVCMCVYVCVSVCVCASFIYDNVYYIRHNIYNIIRKLTVMNCPERWYNDLCNSRAYKDIGVDHMLDIYVYEMSTKCSQAF